MASDLRLSKLEDAVRRVPNQVVHQLLEEKKEDDSLGGADWEMWTKNDKLFPPNLPKPIVDAVKLSACDDPALFVPPKWILKRAREALQARGVRTLLLLGLPGQGKTHAVCSLAKWLRQDKAGGGQKICVTHFCSFKAKLSLKPHHALWHLAGLLAEQVPLFRAELCSNKQLQADLGLSVEEGQVIAKLRGEGNAKEKILIAVEAMATALVRVFAPALPEKQGSSDAEKDYNANSRKSKTNEAEQSPRIIIFVDGLDEAWEEGPQTVEMLAALLGHDALAATGRVQFVLSSRPLPALLETLKAHITEDAIDNINLADKASGSKCEDEVRRYVDARLRRHLKEKSPAQSPTQVLLEEHLEHLHIVCGDNFLHANLVMEALEGKNIELTDLKNIPCTDEIWDKVEFFLERQFPNVEDREALTPLLSTLAVASSSLPVNKLLAGMWLTGDDTVWNSMLTRTKKQINQLVSYIGSSKSRGKGTRIALAAHHSSAEELDFHYHVLRQSMLASQHRDDTNRKRVPLVPLDLSLGHRCLAAALLHYAKRTDDLATICLPPLLRREEVEVRKLRKNIPDALELQLSPEEALQLLSSVLCGAPDELARTLRNVSGSNTSSSPCATQPPSPVSMLSRLVAKVLSDHPAARDDAVAKLPAFCEELGIEGPEDLDTVTEGDLQHYLGMKTAKARRILKQLNSAVSAEEAKQSESVVNTAWLVKAVASLPAVDILHNKANQLADVIAHLCQARPGLFQEALGHPGDEEKFSSSHLADFMLSSMKSAEAKRVKFFKCMLAALELADQSLFSWAVSHSGNGAEIDHVELMEAYLRYSGSVDIQQLRGLIPSNLVLSEKNCTLSHARTIASFAKMYTMLESVTFNERWELSLVEFRNAQMTSLELSAYRFGNEEAIIIGALLQGNSAIKSINLAFNYNITGEAAAKLAQVAVEECKSLGEFSGIPIAKLKASDPSITELDFSDKGFGDAEAYVLGMVLQTNNILQSLNLRGGDGADRAPGKIGNGGASAIAEALKVNTGLTSLDMSQNRQVTDEGWVEFAKGLADNNTLKVLNLQENEIGNAGAAALAKALEVNTCLTRLNMRCNSQITDKGCAEFAKGLAVNTGLTSLDMEYHWNITGKGWAELAKGLADNTSVTSVNLKNNEIGDKGATAIAGMLMVNTGLTSLNMSGSRQITDWKGWVEFAKGLATNNTLQSLNLSGSTHERGEIGDFGASAIAEALKANKHLTSLDMSDNKDITEEGWAEIVRGLAVNTGLTSLDMSLNRHIFTKDLAELSRLCNVNATLAKARRRDQVDPIEHEQALLERGGFRFPEHRFLEPKEIWEELILSYMKAHDGLIAVEGAGALPAQEIERLKSTVGTRDCEISEESLLSNFAKLSS